MVPVGGAAGYSGAVSSDGRRWLLLAAICAVLVGIVAMHHAPASSMPHGEPAMSAPAAPMAPAVSDVSVATMPEQHPGGHDLLHDCLAALTKTTLALFILGAFA